jgi:hypothetical protein
MGVIDRPGAVTWGSNDAARGRYRLFPVPLAGIAEHRLPEQYPLL